MSLDEPQLNDHVQVINQIQVAIEQDLEEYTKGLVFDYDKERRSFAFLGSECC
ncbi:hypothetical protein JMM81_08485 [Bacillus sp. V3B]|uniref:hypothetical protein n=1 Tax=Bacillus sp. V3B TaxID=2804915 RepID=UPI00210AFF5A|nr:hypothetical protein [Bacillus sp. V3B]MCQ6274997.1 hypothetical protein [Bacillus sp. V3B]